MNGSDRINGHFSSTMPKDRINRSVNPINMNTQSTARNQPSQSGTPDHRSTQESVLTRQGRKWGSSFRSLDRRSDVYVKNILQMFELASNHVLLGYYLQVKMVKWAFIGLMTQSCFICLLCMCSWIQTYVIFFKKLYKMSYLWNNSFFSKPQKPYAFKIIGGEC